MFTKGYMKIWMVFDRGTLPDGREVLMSVTRYEQWIEE